MSDPMTSLLAPMRAAIQQYDMIAAGDHIAVGVSGGKDSLALLAALARLRTFYPLPFSLTAITLDPCFLGEEGDYSAIEGLCRQWEIPYILKRTQLWEVVFEQRREDNPCSLCARMRRGLLHRTAVEAGCRVVALGHHMDDAAETFWMNLMSGGTLGCFSPKSYLDRRQITLIRPFIFLKEAVIASAVQRLSLPVVPSRCPADGCTHRQQAKAQLAGLSGIYGPLPDKILHALQKAGLNGW